MTLSFCLLTNDPDLSKFECDNTSIENMVRSSYFAVARKQAAAYAVIQNESVVAYIMISIGAITFDSDVYDGSDNSYGAIRIKYIVVDKPLRKQNIGTGIMNSLIKLSRNICNRYPIRFLVLDSLTECCDWYEKLGFQFVSEKDVHKHTNLMYMDFVNREQLEAYTKSWE